MNAAQKALAGILAATAVTGSLIAVNLPPVGSAVIGTKAFRIRDGGALIYIGKCPDGGTCRATDPGFRRRGVGGSSAVIGGCRRCTAAFPNIGEPVGELNRFPAAEACPAINSCEAVAAEVMQGEDANQDEQSIVDQLPLEILP